MGLLSNLWNVGKDKTFARKLKNTLGIYPTNINLYKMALSHRSISDDATTNNERLEYLGDAILGAIVADYLFKRYPYKGEGFLTEMRSKMVNRQHLNDIAIKMGLKQLTQFNKHDNMLKNSQIFGNTLEAVVGAVYLDKGYMKTQKWVLQYLVNTHMYVDSLEMIDINLKNKLIGWATKNGKDLAFAVSDEKKEGTRKLFTIDVVINSEIVSTGKAFNKKDASQKAAQEAIEKLGL